MKPGAFFVNTARGKVVDYKALSDAITTRWIRVAQDVYAAEPSGATGEFHDPIVGLPHVYGTHHIGASTDQAQEAIAAETVNIIRTYKETGTVPERRQPGETDAGVAHARRAPPRQAGRARARIQPPAQPQLERAGDRPENLPSLQPPLRDLRVV
jgi:hypothetical protein